MDPGLTIRAECRGVVGLTLAAAAMSVGLAPPAVVQADSIVMASATSTEQSGLFTHLPPAFGRARGIDERMVAVGTSPGRHRPHTETALAQAFSGWVVSPEGQATLAAYKIGGEPLFFPNAARR